MDLDALLRLDAGTLRPPRMQADGSVRFEAVLARVDAPLPYPHGVEVATEAALSDRAYLDALVGLAVVVHHPEGGSHRIDEAPRNRTGERRGVEVGRVLSARYDTAERHVVVDLLITKRDAIRRIRAKELGEVSEGYRVPASKLVKRADGISEQQQRIPDHVALTDRGRPGGTTIRTDEEGRMDPKDIEAVVRTVLTEVRADEAVAAKQTQESAAVKRADAAEAALGSVLGELGLKPGASVADVRTAIGKRADAVVALRRRADELGVQLPTEGDEVTLTAALAKGLRADAARCDADPAYARAVVDLARAPSTTRADAAPAPRFAV